MAISTGDRTQIRAIALGLERVTERVMTKVTLDLTANLIETTPVDTGWARAHWVPSIGSAFNVDLSGVEASSALAAGARNEQQQAVAGITGYKLSQGAIFVSNNVPYIGRLNDGHSRQQPAGFIQRAIAKALTSDLQGLSGTEIRV